MRRLTLGAALVAALLLMVAAIAVAAPPKVCDPGSKHYNPDHPSCSTTTTEPPALQACTPDEEGVITVPGSGRTGFECLWTPENNGSAIGTVTVTPISGAISMLVVFVHDASPGDICVNEHEFDGQPGPEFVASFPLADERGTYWEYTNPDDGLMYHGEHWCEQYDPVSGQRADPNGEPLHLFVGFVAKRGTEVNISLSPGQATP